MRIKVINLKNTSNYFIKILILVAIVLIFGRFFYNTKNVRASMKVNSSKLAKIMNTEIALFSNVSNNNGNVENNSDFSKITINEEITLAKLVNNQNLMNKENAATTANALNSENSNANSNETAISTGASSENASIQNQNQSIETQETIAEPETRSKY